MSDSDDGAASGADEDDRPADPEDLAAALVQVRQNLEIAAEVDAIDGMPDLEEAEQVARLRELAGPLAQALRSTAEDRSFWRVLRRGEMANESAFLEHEPVLDALAHLPWSDLLEQFGGRMDDLVPDLQDLASGLPRLFREGGTRTDANRVRDSLRALAAELEDVADVADIHAQRRVRKGARLLTRVSFGVVGVLVGTAIGGPAGSAAGFVGGGMLVEMLGEAVAEATAAVVSAAAGDRVEAWFEDPSPMATALQDLRDESGEFVHFVRSLEADPARLAAPDVHRHVRDRLERLRLASSGAWVWLPRRTAQRGGVDAHFRQATAVIDEAARSLADLPVRTEELFDLLDRLLQELPDLDHAVVAALAIHGR